MNKFNVQSSKFKVLYFLLFTFIFLLGNANAQFTTEYDTLLILSGDSSTVVGWTYDATADTSGGTPYTGYTAGIDLNGKHLVGIDFDTTSAFTATAFGIQTSATYNSSADTSGGTPYDWKTVYYAGNIVKLVPKVAGINMFTSTNVYALKRYVRFICLDGSDVWNVNEAAPRKLIALIRSGF